MDYISVREAANVLKLTVQGLHKFVKDSNIILPREKNAFYITPEIFEQILKLRGIKKKKLLISTTCVKGGVGKTTIANALSSKMAALGHKVLMIDVDQQANLTTSFNITAQLEEIPTVIDVYKGYFKGDKIKIKDAIINIRSYLDIIPANLGLAALDNEFGSKTENIATFFHDFLKPIDHLYDIILVDTPPSLSKFTSAIHAASNLIVIPINMDRFSLDGMNLTIDSILSLNGKFNVAPDVKVVINKFDARSKLGFEIIQKLLLSDFKNILSNNYISVSKNLDNAIAAKASIWDQKYKSSTQEDLLNLTLEILEFEKHISNSRDIDLESVGFKSSPGELTSSNEVNHHV